MPLTQAQRKALRIGVEYATQGTFLVSGQVRGVGKDYHGEPAPYIPERTAEAMVRAGVLVSTRIPSRFKLTADGVERVRVERARDHLVHGIVRLGDDTWNRFAAEGYKAQVTVWWRANDADASGLAGQYLASHLVTRYDGVTSDGAQRKVPTASVSPDDADAVSDATRRLYESLGYDTVTVQVRDLRVDVVEKRRLSCERRANAESLVHESGLRLDSVSTRADAGTCLAALDDADDLLDEADVVLTTMSAALDSARAMLHDDVATRDRDLLKARARVSDVRQRAEKLRDETESHAWRVLRRVEAAVGQSLDACIATDKRSLRAHNGDPAPDTVTLNVGALCLLAEALEAADA